MCFLTLTLVVKLTSFRIRPSAICKNWKKYKQKNFNLIYIYILNKFTVLSMTVNILQVVIRIMKITTVSSSNCKCYKLHMIKMDAMLFRRWFQIFVYWLNKYKDTMLPKKWLPSFQTNFLHFWLSQLHGVT